MIKSIIKILILTAIIAAAALYLLFAPNHATKLNYKGSSITIQRNHNNIPNIYAPSRQAYFYAIGWVQAEDRLFQMTFKLLLIQGRLAEYLGEKAVMMDQAMRELDLDGWGKRAADRMARENETEYANLQAFTDSINDFARTLVVLPFDFLLIGYKWQDWTPADVIGLFKLLEWSQSMNLVDEYTRSLLLANHSKEEVERLMPISKENWAFESTVMIEDHFIPQQLKTDSPNIVKSSQFSPQILQEYTELGLFEFFKSVEGSNVFAISGQHTKSGSPVLVHDPHLQNVIPSQWYQIQAIYINNGVNHSISGISCAGIPFIVGKTDYLAFGITTIYADNQDLYRETIKDGQYLVNEKWMDLRQRKETIKVKTDKGIQQQSFTIRQTHRGPVISHIFSPFGSYKTDNVSLRWTGFNDEFSAVIAASLVPQARDIEYLKHFLLYNTEYLFNVNCVFITNDGHIGYQQLGRYPLRSDPSSAHFVKDGRTTEHDWLGFVPPHHRLQIIDPSQGYLANANNRIAGHDYYNGLHDYTIFTARSDRIHELISEQIAQGRKFEMQDLKDILFDTVDSYCQRILPDIRALLPQAEALLGDFDCNFTSASSAAAVYEVFMFELHQLIKPLQAMGMSTMSFHPVQQQLYNFIRQAKTDSSEAGRLQQAWLNMKHHLSAFFGSNSTSTWSWGKFHQDAMHHLPFTKSPLSFLYDRAFDGSGNMHTVNVGKMNKVGLGNFQTSHRANYRAIYSFTEESFWIIDSGSSEKFFSPHYDDQWLLFQQNQLLPLAALVAPSGRSLEL